MFNAEKIITIDDKPTCEEINEYYKTHTLLETVKHFHHRSNRLNIDPKLKKGRCGAGKVPSIETEVQAVFLKTFMKKSDLALSQLVGVSNKTVAAIEGGKEPLKNFFEKYRMQLGNACSEYLTQSVGLLFNGMMIY